MMLPLLLLLQEVPSVPPGDPVPSDWSVLPPLSYAAPPMMTPPFSRFVAREVAAGRCRRPRPADGLYVITFDLAALVSADGAMLRLVPRAIDCPTVEQYAAGLVQNFARGNLNTVAGAVGTQWYRTTVTFEWRD